MKRTKTEVEIRNILSEILLHSLRSSADLNILDLIIKYCGKANADSIDRVYLKDLLEKKPKLGSVGFNWKHVSKDRYLKELFVFGTGSSIGLNKRYSKYRAFICKKTRAYLKFISSLKTGAQRIDDQLEDKVNVGVMLYNNGFFFECHEFLEEIWLKEKGREKVFLKGLIHACVAFYHLEYENIRGTLGYLKRSYSRLKEFQPNFLGVDVSCFLLDIERSLESFEESKSEYSKDFVPTIKLID